MKQFVEMITGFLKAGIDAVFKFIEVVWGWSFGNIFAIFQSDWQSLPIWKMAILAIVVVAIGYVLYKAVIELWKATEQILQAFIALLSMFVKILPHVLIAGVIAAVGSYVIQNINI